MSLLLTHCPIPTCQAKIFGGDCAQVISVCKNSHLRKHYYTVNTNKDMAHIFMGKGFAIWWLEVALKIKMKFIGHIQDFIRTDNIIIIYNNASLEDAVKMYQRLDNLKAFI
ncbi:MAG TPA: hypothetical protein VII94_04160 [Candidatus Saccharimonadales bacterium]